MAIHLICHAKSDDLMGPSFCSICIDQPLIDDMRRAVQVCVEQDWSYIGMDLGVYFYDGRVPVADGDTIIFASSEVEADWDASDAQDGEVGEDVCELRIPTTRVEVCSSGTITLLGWESTLERGSARPTRRHSMIWRRDTRPSHPSSAPVDHHAE